MGLNCIRQPTNPTRTEISPNPIAIRCLDWSQTDPNQKHCAESTLFGPDHFKKRLEPPRSGVPFLLGLLNTYLTLNSLSILAILSKYFEFRFTFCAHFRNLEGLEGFHSLCLQHLANTGPHRLSILTNFHFIARKPATSKTLNFHFNEFPFHRENCTSIHDGTRISIGRPKLIRIFASHFLGNSGRARADFPKNRIRPDEPNSLVRVPRLRQKTVGRKKLGTVRYIRYVMKSTKIHNFIEESRKHT